MAELILFKRLTEHPDDSFTLERYLATGGYSALRKALTEMSPEQILEEVKTSGLRGRGGAGFATGAKWGFLPPDVRPRYLVVNGDEGEPGTFKDRQLMEQDPHQLVEGVAIAAAAIDAAKSFIYIRGEMRLAFARVQRAIDEAYQRGYLGKDVYGSGRDIDIVLYRGAGAYICGEETALLSSLEGHRGEPRLKPPFPAVAGLYAKPTIINNVETLSNLPHIIERGGAWYASLGTEKSTGMRIFCLSGHVDKPGNYEVELGITFRQLIDDYGGGMRDGREMKFFIPGGGSAPWWFPDKLDVRLDMDEVGAQGSMLGSGAVMVADQTQCPVVSAWRLVKFFEHESCGQCTPCREGCGWMTKILRRIETGAGRPADLDLLLDIGDNIAPGWKWGMWPYNYTTICLLGPSAVVPMGSALAMFRDDFERHVAEKGCPYRDSRTPVGAISSRSLHA